MSDPVRAALQAIVAGELAGAAPEAVTAIGEAARARHGAAVNAVLFLVAAPFRVPVELGTSEAFLLLPLYAVLLMAVVALVVRALRGEAVRALTRIEPDEDRVAHLRNYFFEPDFIAEVCAELGVPFRANGYRWWLTGRC